MTDPGRLSFDDLLAGNVAVDEVRALDVPAAETIPHLPQAPVSEVPPAPDPGSAPSEFLPESAGHSLASASSMPFPVAPAALPAPMSRRERREREDPRASRRRRTSRPAASSRTSSRSASRPASGRTKAPRVRSRIRSRIRVSRESIGKRLLSLGAMVFAGSLAVGLSLPANAFNTIAQEPAEQENLATLSALAAVTDADNVQTLSVADVEVAAPERAEWTVLSWAEQLRQRYGSRDYSYTVGDGPIRWPFPYAVGISDGFGDRVSPCRGCSSYHRGVDFIPGNGAAIFAIADGVVIEHVPDNWSYGNNVTIEHNIDGHVVTSKYAHMQYGSSPLKVGEEIKVGDFVGLVGSTGASTGPHLHLEIAVDGVKVDPFAWLKVMAG